ncbi:Hsp20/alpha crystallin family protein [Geomonas sp. RF6]|uniref:Hsp20/alpha crystallin family protein n=1 Tax=Geomonas sp. RF6 TaxID=2897342 RepID=UPI001E4838A7|nr:Hsp20/alpha crystallin family protein [Geomonas sp. RF6]UFS72628.1 Hsp20/alpha crystallin family protein [Geomonas sp. RF6]
MAIVKYNPLGELRSMQDKMNRLLDLAWRKELGEELREGVWQPAADIYEDDGSVTVKVELPDLELSDVDVKVEKGTLTIRGERRHNHEARKENFHRIERSYGPFQRTFAFPMELEAKQIGTELDCGVLTVTIPKKKR